MCPRSLLLALMLGACTASPPPAETSGGETTDDAAVAALERLLGTRYCEADACLDPYPLWAVEAIATRGDEIALVGPGALLARWDGRGWTIDVPDPAVELHAVAFADDGTLWVGGTAGALYAAAPGAALARVTETVDENAAVLDLALRGSSVFVAGRDGVARLEGDRLVPVGERAAVSAIGFVGEAIVARGPFSTWVGSAQDGRALNLAAHWRARGEVDGCGPYSPETLDAEFGPFDVHPLAEAPVPDHGLAAFLAARAGAAGLRGWADPAVVLPRARAREGDARLWVSDDRYAATFEGHAFAGPLPVDAPPIAVSVHGRVGCALGARTLGCVRADGTSLAVPLELDDVRSVLVLDDTHALVIAGEGRIVRVSLEGGAPVLVADTGLPLQHLARAGAWLWALGRDGAALRASDDGASFTPIATGVSADLLVVSASETRAVLGGAQGTVVVVDERGAHRLPRATPSAIGALALAGGDTIVVRDASTHLFAWDGASWWQHASTAVETSDLLLDLGTELLPDRVPAPPPSLALDEPGAVAPYRAIASFYRYAPGAFESRDGAAFAGDDERSEMAWPESTCCDGGYFDDGYDLLSEWAAECLAEPAWSWCVLGPDEAFALAPDTGRRIRIALAGPGPGACAALRVEVVSSSGAVEATETVTCEAGGDTRDARLWSFLAAHAAGMGRLEPADAQTFDPAADPAGLVGHRVEGGIDLVVLDPENRHATVLAHVPGTLAHEWEPLSAWTSGRWVLVASADEDDPFVWAGDRATLVPAGSAAPAATTPEETPATCDALVVADPDGTTTLRSLPSSRSEAIVLLGNGIRLSVVERNGRWIRVTSSRSGGWVYEENVDCAP